MDALSLMYKRKPKEKEKLTTERLQKLIYKINHRMGPVFSSDVLEIELMSGFKEVKILFPLKHFNEEIAENLNKIPEIDRWHIINGKVGVFFK
jgi:hypothetical protein